MGSLTFRIEWEAGDGVRHPALAATWARIEILVNGHPVTVVRDKRTGGTRTGVYGPAFVLAEWIVRNFEFLLNESAPAGRVGTEWAQRHSLLAAREGTSLPDLRLWRDDGSVAVQWKPTLDFGSRPVVFVGSGEARLGPRDASSELVSVVDLVLDRVRDIEHPEIQALNADWEAITSAVGDEKKLLDRAARIGVDAYDDPNIDRFEAILLGGIDEVPDSTRDDLLDAGLAPDRLAPTIGLVADTLRNGRAKPALTGGVPRNSIGQPPPAARAYEQGYGVAKNLRAQVQPIRGAVDLNAVEGELGWSGLLDESKRNWTDVDTNVKALVGMSPDGFPRIIADPRRSGRHDRFVRARSLYFLLVGATESAPRLVTSGGTWLQASSRAFAAELLAPAEEVLAKAGRKSDEERIDELADEFNVSPWVITHQLENAGH